MAKRVSVVEAAELMKQGWTYLDVRSIPEFEQGHPAGAANIPLNHAVQGRMAPNPDFRAVVEANFARDARLVVGCKMGGRSAQAAALLEAAGFTSVVDVRGGYSGERDMLGRVAAAGWVDSGLPTSREPSAGAAYAELANKVAR